MTRSSNERLSDIDAAIAAARVADERLHEADAVGDAPGVRLAFDAILHNLFVIGHHYHRIAPAIIHRTVQNDLAPLSAAVDRLRGTSAEERDPG